LQQLGALQTRTTDTHCRHTLQTHTTDTHYRHIPLYFSHNERTPVQIFVEISSFVLELLKKCRVRWRVGHPVYNTF